MDRSESPADHSLKVALLRRVPKESRAWVEALLVEADSTTLQRFLFWHSERSMEAIFSWIPPWPPSDWRIFVQHGLPDWMPMFRNVATYLTAVDALDLRRRATQISGCQDPLQVAYRVFAWVHRNIEWQAVWGAASPREVLKRGGGDSFHFAQLCCMLLRSVFIPARVVEEVALAPATWIEQAGAVWSEAPKASKRWLGHDILYHPFCEARIGGRWIPFDAQRAQFGWSEMLQHIRAPGLLKLVVRTWEDYGRYLHRTQHYTLQPMGLTGNDPDTDLGKDLAAMKDLLGEKLDQLPPNPADYDALTGRIKEAAWKAWLTRASEHRFSVEAPEGLSPAAEAYLRAAAPAPLRILGDENPSPLGINETRVLLGSAVRHALEPGYRQKVEAGAHLVVLLEAWGSGEQHAQELLAFLGGHLGPWLSSPDSVARPTPVRGSGTLCRGRGDPLLLDLRLVRSLEGLGSGNGTLGTEPEDPTSRRVFAWRSARGKGVVTLAPVALAARGDPYAIGFTAGCHRRTMLDLMRRPTDASPRKDHEGRMRLGSTSSTLRPDLSTGTL